MRGRGVRRDPASATPPLRSGVVPAARPCPRYAVRSKCDSSRRTRRGSFLRVSSCSQRRRTRQPSVRRVRVMRRSRVRLAESCGCLRPAGARKQPPLRFAAGPHGTCDHLRAAALRFCARRRRWFWATWRGVGSRARSSRRRRRRGGVTGKRSRAYQSRADFAAALTWWEVTSPRAKARGAFSPATRSHPRAVRGRRRRVPSLPSR